eukprot:6008579-Karenia_brevis.AAC.1
MAILNAADPSNRQLIFKGFSESAAASARLAFIETLLQDHALRLHHVDHIFTGPKNDCKISKITYA